MTNAMIILMESVRLMDEGKLRGTGQFIEVQNDDGTTKQLELPEEIHTFNGWKERGFVVKKGEKSDIKFPIWKHTRKMLNTDTGNAELDKMNYNINAQGGKTNMFLKTAAFFTADQVEAIKA